MNTNMHASCREARAQFRVRVYKSISHREDPPGFLGLLQRLHQATLKGGSIRVLADEYFGEVPFCGRHSSLQTESEILGRLLLAEVFVILALARYRIRFKWADVL
jgi:hypothetical protein